MKNRVVDIRKDIDDTREIMNNNIKTLIDNGEKLENLSDKTDELLNQATIFSETSKSLSNAYRWAKYKTYAIGSAFILGGGSIITSVVLHSLGFI